MKVSHTYYASLEVNFVMIAFSVQNIQQFPYARWAHEPLTSPPPPPHLKCALDTRTKFVPYTIIFKLVPKFKLLHQSEVTVAQGTLLRQCSVQLSCPNPSSNQVSSLFRLVSCKTTSRVSECSALYSSSLSESCVVSQ